jgi:anti-sigma factor RsiW
MNCKRTQSELIVYHFGIIEDEVRCEVEAHLVSCTECLRSYLALKRDIEAGESGPEPSPVVLDRVRRSAARELAITSVKRWSWWERPFAFGFAAAVVLIAMGAATAIAHGPGSAPRGLGLSSLTPSHGAH